MQKGGRYWLLKSEPSVFSIDDLERSPRKTTSWEGVRNYQARNFMREMKRGDHILFYHSHAAPPAVVGVATLVRTAYPDPSAWDRKSTYYDPRSTPTHCRWDMVDIRLIRRFARPLSLDFLRRQSGLKHMELLRRGSRLSVQPVWADEWKVIQRLARSAGEYAVSEIENSRVKIVSSGAC